MIDPATVETLAVHNERRKECIGFKTCRSEDGGHNVCVAQYAPHPKGVETAAILRKMLAENVKLRADMAALVKLLSRAVNGPWYDSDLEYARATIAEWEAGNG